MLQNLFLSFLGETQATRREGIQLIPHQLPNQDQICFWRGDLEVGYLLEEVVDGLASDGYIISAAGLVHSFISSAVIPFSLFFDIA
jgi:hypothetical protein